MKMTMMAVLIAPAALMAQKKTDLYVDIGCNDLGMSVTYDRKLTRHLEVGLGAQVYDWGGPRVNVRTAVYADVRPYWNIGRSRVFTFFNVGAVHFAGRKPGINTTYQPINLYCGIGAGYAYLFSPRSIGPYVSINMRSALQSQYTDNPALAPSARRYSVFDLSPVLSLGFKF